MSKKKIRLECDICTLTAIRLIYDNNEVLQEKYCRECFDKRIKKGPKKEIKYTWGINIGTMPMAY